MLHTDRYLYVGLSCRVVSATTDHVHCSGLLGTFCPCVVFGRIHHRLHKNGSLEGYNWLNTSCLFSAGSRFVPFLPLALFSMQRADVRRKYDLQGSCVSDILLTCCCGCCSIIQQDNEAAHREKELAGNVKEQYKSGDQMTYPQ
jgi:Cys-rich protein (TIGR01571 family)